MVSSANSPSADFEIATATGAPCASRQPGEQFVAASDHADNCRARVSSLGPSSLSRLWNSISL